MKVKRIGDKLIWDVFENRKQKMFRSNKTMNNDGFFHWEATQSKVNTNQETWILQLVKTTSRKFSFDKSEVMQKIEIQELRDAMKFAEKTLIH